MMSCMEVVVMKTKKTKKQEKRTLLNTDHVKPGGTDVTGERERRERGRWGMMETNRKEDLFQTLTMYGKEGDW